MKTFLIVLSIFVGANCCSAQISTDSLRNYNWILGYGNEPNGTIYHTLFNFNSDSLKISYKVIPNSLYMSYTNGSISDSFGNLLFFSNGCGVMDTNFNFIPGCEKINEGITQEYLCENSGGGRIPCGMIVLSDRIGERFNIFSSRVNNELPESPVVDRLYWTQVKVEPDGLKAMFKDKIILDSLLYAGNLASCRHGNGNDWWLVAPGYSSEIQNSISNRYYIIKISGDSAYINQEYIGIPTDDFEDITGEAAFSPDGSKYARYTIHSDLQIFDFDRCSGDFSNPIHIPILDAADTIWAAGVAFSPSGRYLYASSSSYIYQFDMQSNDIAMTKTTVAVYDGFTYPSILYTSRFYQCELAPDGKIYVSCPGGRSIINVIEHPDSAGVACQVVQHKFLLEWPIYGGLPQFPNFRLGALPDSICPKDMVAINEPKGSERKIQVYPNPASENITIFANSSACDFQVFNLLGEIVFRGTYTGSVTTIDVSEFQSGVYFLSFKGMTDPVKVVVSR
jgi:Secretion system C-terminal sorting domain